MKLKRNLDPLLPAITGLILLVWGLWVMFTAFKYGTLPVAGWRTEHRHTFGLTWFIVFFVVLLPAYAYSISLGLRSLRKKDENSPQTKHSLRASVGITALLVLLTFCSRVAVTAWFPTPMHPPLDGWQGGRFPGLTATMVLLLVEGCVLAGLKYQTPKNQRPIPLLIPGFLAFIQLLWAGWLVQTAFTEGSFPSLDWETEQKNLFGWVWTAAALIILLPAYVYAIALGLLGWFERHRAVETMSQNYWLVAIGMTALLCLLTFCTRIAVTAWFPERIHPPFSDFQGGLVAGLIATSVLAVVVIGFHKVARSF